MSFGDTRALLVGAGGIGCELLKTLCLHNFKEIFIVFSLKDPQPRPRNPTLSRFLTVLTRAKIDLDTIDLSNLNRQFLFRQQHIKKSKALVRTPPHCLSADLVSFRCCRWRRKFRRGLIRGSCWRRDMPISRIRSSILNFSTDLILFLMLLIISVPIFGRIGMLMLDARRHVNRMCLAADVPLIESGTTGFQGQVQPIVRVITPKRAPPLFPSRFTYYLCVHFRRLTTSDSRARQNATTVTPKKSPNPSLSAQSAPLPRNQSIVSSGQNHTSLPNSSVLTRMKFPKLTTRPTHPTQRKSQTCDGKQRR